jgi:hypothetical protein
VRGNAVKVQTVQTLLYWSVTRACVRPNTDPLVRSALLDQTRGGLRHKRQASRARGYERRSVTVNTRAGAKWPVFEGSQIGNQQLSRLMLSIYPIKSSAFRGIDCRMSYLSYLGTALGTKRSQNR